MAPPGASSRRYRHAVNSVVIFLVGVLTAVMLSYVVDGLGAQTPVRALVFAVAIGVTVAAVSKKRRAGNR